MFDYLQKFNNLPKDLRDKVSSPSIMAAISDLESQYRVDLAMVVMKVMIKETDLKDLPAYFVSEFGFLPISAEHLVRDLKEKVFAPVAYYLDLMNEIRALDIDRDINVVVKEAGLTFSSQVLVDRFRKVLITYLKGIRDKIDTRATLAKDIKIGGLNLSPEEVERVLKVCDNHKFKNYNPNESPASRAAAPVSRLDSVIKSAEQSMASSAAEYNLQDSLKSARPPQQSDSSLRPAATDPSVSKPAADPAIKASLKAPSPLQSLSAPEIRPRLSGGLDLAHELEAPDKISSLPLPSHRKSLTAPSLENKPLENKPLVSEKKSLDSLPKDNSALQRAEKSESFEPLSALISKKIDKSEKTSTPVSLVHGSAAKPGLPPASHPADPIFSAAATAAAKTIKKPVSKSGWFGRLFKKESKSAPPVAKTPLKSPVPTASANSAGKNIVPPVAPKAGEASSLKPGVFDSRVANTAKASSQKIPDKSFFQKSQTKPSPAPVVSKAPLAANISGNIPGKISPVMSRPAPISSVSRPHLHDIRPATKVVGPIEELQSLDLVNFRRLDKNPSLAANKILIKIKLLEKDGYDKMVAGIQAWRRSPINKLYVGLGQEAIIKGKTMQEIINLRLKEGRESINHDELGAILEFNNKLSF